MKKISTLTIATLLVSTASLAGQNDYSSNYSSSSSSTSLNLTGGLGFSTISTTDADTRSNIKNRTGLNISAMMDLPLSDSFSVLTGLSYIQKGTSAKVSDELAPFFSANFVLNYIELPLTLQSKLHLGGSSLSLGAGGFLALAVSKNIVTTGTFMGQSTDDVQPMGDAVSSIDYGVRVGANFEAPITSDLSFLVGANYDLGLKNLNTTSEPLTTKTRSLLANVGLGFKI